MEKYVFNTVIGKICVFYQANNIVKIQLNSNESNSENINENIHKIELEIKNYLNCTKKHINVPFSIKGSNFERSVLKQISLIKYGETITYKELAKRSGYPNAYRACGTVCKKNKLPLVIPCHRVIKSDGTVGDYSGGKLIKRFLLNLENTNNNS